MISLSIILLSIGIFLFLRDLIDTKIDLELYAERWRVPEEIRHLHGHATLVLALRHFSTAVFGAVLIVLGASRLAEAEVSSSFPVFGMSLMAISLLVTIVFVRVNCVSERLSAIETKWRKERLISPIHNHEVNLYRGLRDCLQGLGNDIVKLSVLLLLVLFL